MTFDAWVPGLIATAATGVLVALVAIMLRQSDQTMSPVRAVVVSLLGSLLGFFVGIVVQDTWQVWYACILCAIGAAGALVVGYGRSDDRADAKDEVAREQAAIESGQREDRAVTQRSRQ